MKKQIMSLLVGGLSLLVSGCSNHDVSDNLIKGDASTDKNSYIAVTIAPNIAETRAEGDANDYENGDVAENTITNVRFYFFTSDGKIANVKRTKDGDMVNYLDLTVAPSSDGTSGDPNVEKGLNAVLVINTAQGDERPAKILAVCNRSNRLDNNSKDLESVRSTCYDYANFAEQSSQFVMSSSVYASTSGQEISAVTIPEDCFQDQESGANLNPVVLYVERVVAKVRVKLDSEALTCKTVTVDGKNYTLVALLKDNEEGNTADNYLKIGDTQVYARFLGWNVTAATEQSSLSKYINPAWDVFPNWNYAPFFRSYWARNCNNAGTRYMPFFDNGESDYSVTGGREMTTSYTSMYVNENAAAYSEATNGNGRQHPSTVIMAAQLCKEDGTPINAYHWLGQMQVGEDHLKTAMLAQLDRINSKLYYKETAPDGSTVIKSIAADDLSMYTAIEAGKGTADPSTSGRYFTYVMLSDAGKARVWYGNHACTDDSRMDTAAVNAFLNSTLGSAEIWNNGYTYYYFPIRHLGSEKDGLNMGAYGVVRNHVYQVNINKITGMGTPVYNPEEEIIPEKPGNSDTFVSAKINILSWRLVHNNVELDWSAK